MARFGFFHEFNIGRKITYRTILLETPIISSYVPYEATIIASKDLQRIIRGYDFCKSGGDVFENVAYDVWNLSPEDTIYYNRRDDDYYFWFVVARKRI